MSDPAAPETGASSARAVRGVILAGGQNTRFGGIPKGLMEVGGRRMLDHVASVLAEATGHSPLLVANAPDAGSWRPDLEVVPDRRPGAGSLGGLYTGLVTAGTSIVCLGWDMPFVRPGLLQAILDAVDRHDIVLPESLSGRGVEPLCGSYAPSCIGPIARHLDAGDLRMIGFHDRLRVGRLRLDEVQRHGDPVEMFWNVNTPEDLREAQNLWARRESFQS